MNKKEKRQCFYDEGVGRDRGDTVEIVGEEY